MSKTLVSAALDVLNTANAEEKALCARAGFAAWGSGEIQTIGICAPQDLPLRPARPERPALCDPKDMPKRSSASSGRGKIALLHALAHIELNAIDLACDIVARFSNMAEENISSGFSSLGFSLPRNFYNDWIKVADDEAKHFLMLQSRLKDFNAVYGDLPAHDGLWESATRTADDFAARLAIVPMVLEARGLDVTPNMVAMMIQAGDEETARLLQIIHDDEITHVRAGTVWFEAWCVYHGKDVETYWQELVRAYFKGTLKRPFNHPSREEAGMLRDWYETLADEILYK